jgi:hypothetical protein
LFDRKESLGILITITIFAPSEALENWVKGQSDCPKVKLP